MESLLNRAKAAWGLLTGSASAAQQSLNTQLEDSFLIADPLDERSWDDWLARGQRYRLLWACYEGTPYAKAHPWSLAYRQTYQLYAHTRNVFSPAYAIGEFQARHLMGGPLDRKAGDGQQSPSALPIATDHEALREPIAQIWRHSHWKGKRTVWTRYGAVMGDAPLMVYDDPEKRRVTLMPIRPHTVKHLDLDGVGNVKGYVIEYERPDPLWVETYTGAIPPSVTYTEICERQGETVVYGTFRSGAPFDWRTYDPGETPIGPFWTVPYGFVPMVLVQHRDLGFNWGMSEFHALLSKIREVDDLGSCATDQARKLLNGPWAINTRQPSDLTDKKKRVLTDEMASEGTTASQGRDELILKWIDRENLKVVHLVGQMDLEAVGRHTDRVLDTMARDFPELLLNNLSVTGDTSGRARRYLRESAEQKIQDGRGAYDDALVRAHQMAISIGAIRGYPGFEAFTPESYDAGDLDHEIGKRGAFAGDPFDDVELEQAKANAIMTLVNANVPLDTALRRVGWSEAEATAVFERSQQLQQDAMKRQQKAAALMAGRLPGGNPKKPTGSPLTPPKALEKNGQPSVNGAASSGA